MSESVADGEPADVPKPTYNYSSLCREHFRSTKALPHFSRKELRSPLLKSTPDEELELLNRVWKMILRFMTDTTDNKNNAKASAKSRRQKKPSPSVMPRLRQELSMTGSGQADDKRQNGGEALQSQGAVSRSSENQSSGSSKKLEGLKKRLSFPLSDRHQEVVALDDVVQTGFDQMQFIIGVGILREDLRNEIFCMVLRQLTNNTVKAGRTRLWALLNLMVGAYPPSPGILPYLTKFIEDGPSAFSSSMKKLLPRTQRNGPRYQPPSQVEYMAALNKKPVDLQVTLMDGSSHSISSDSCTTSSEVIRAVAEEIELEETFGFSLFISMENKISSLGFTGDKVFDSISHCEQIYNSSASEAFQWEEVPWRLFMRKEMFSPWDDITENPISTNLVYSQIVRGIMLGEYVCDRDDDLAAVAAMQYYVEFENDVTEDNLYSALPYYVPSHKLTGEDSIRVWCKQVAKFHSRMITAYALADDVNGRSPEEVKAELVTWAKRKWPKAFSRYFDVKGLEGPRWSNDFLILGVNSRGISVSTVKGDVGMDATYPQIYSVMGESQEPGLKTISGSVIIFVFANGTLIKCESADANDIYRLITSNMAELLERSTWAVAKEEFQDSTGACLSCVEGDLIQLTSPAKDEALASEECECSNMATEEEGRIKTRLLHILPCVEQPQEDILRLFRSPMYNAKRTIGKTKQSLETSAEVHSCKDEDEIAMEEEEQEQEMDDDDDDDDDEDDGKLEIVISTPLRGVSQDENEDDVAASDAMTSYSVEDEASPVGGVEKIPETSDTNEEIFNDSESTNIGFDTEFFSALSLFQRELGIGEKQVTEEKGHSSYV